MPITRGKLLTYDSTNGKGLVSVNGARMDFDVADWKADGVPQVGMAVEVHTSDGSTPMFVPVNEADVLKEKLGEIGGKFSSESSIVAKNIVAQVGYPILIAYAFYFLGTVFINFIEVKVMGVSNGASLYDFLKQFSGSIQLLLIASFASVALPVLWKHQRSWLAYIAPLLVLLVVFFKIYGIYSDATNQMALFVGKNNLPSFSDYIHLSAGFYLALLSAAFLAFTGARHYMTNKPL